MNSRLRVTICQLGVRRPSLSPASCTSSMAFAAPKHQPIGVQPWRERKALYVATRTSPSRIYGRRWQKLRAAYLATHPICECGCGHPATVVDHRTSHNGNPDLLYAWDNLVAMTKACHDRKTASSDGGFGNPHRRSPQPPSWSTS